MEGFSLIPKKSNFLYRLDDTGSAPCKTNSLIIIIIIIIIIIQVKQSHYRPGVTQRVPGS